MTKKTLSKDDYIARYGLRAYVWKQFRPQYRVKKLAKLIEEYPEAREGSPITVAEQPEGLMKFDKGVRAVMVHEDINYTEARKITYESELWRRRRRYASYKPDVQKYIREMHKKAKTENRLKKVRGPTGEWVSTWS